MFQAPFVLACSFLDTPLHVFYWLILCDFQFKI